MNSIALQASNIYFGLTSNPSGLSEFYAGLMVEHLTYRGTPPCQRFAIYYRNRNTLLFNFSYLIPFADAYNLHTVQLHICIFHKDI